MPGHIDPFAIKYRLCMHLKYTFKFAFTENGNKIRNKLILINILLTFRNKILKQVDNRQQKITRLIHTFLELNT